MEGRWERLGTPLLQWFVVPVAVFGFGFFVIGPLLRGEAPQEKKEPSPELAEAQVPIEPGERKWIPVSPPQVIVSVTPKEEEEEPLDQTDPEVEPPVDPPETGATGDEAGVGGMQSPPVKRSEQTTGGDSGTAFRGIGGG